MFLPCNQAVDLLGNSIMGNRFPVSWRNAEQLTPLQLTMEA